MVVIRKKPLAMKLVAAKKKKVVPTIAKKKKMVTTSTKAPAKAPKKKVVHPHAFRPNNELVPLTAFAAKCTAIPGIVNATLLLETAIGNRAMVIGTSTGTSGATFAIIAWDDAGVNVRTMYTPPVFALDGLNGGPTASKTMKHSIEVISNTNTLKREGNVRALQLNARIVLPAGPDILTPLQLNILFTKLFGLNDTVNVGCDVLRSPQTLSGVPADAPSYERFRSFVVPPTINNYFAHFSEWPALSDTTDYNRPMSTQIWLFDSVTQQQTYTITGHLTSYCRYPVDTAAHLTSKEQPIADHAEVAKSASLTVGRPVMGGVDKGVRIITE